MFQLPLRYSDVGPKSFAEWCTIYFAGYENRSPFKEVYGSDELTYLFHTNNLITVKVSPSGKTFCDENPIRTRRLVFVKALPQTDQVLVTLKTYKVMDRDHQEMEVSEWTIALSHDGKPHFVGDFSRRFGVYQVDTPEDLIGALIVEDLSCDYEDVDYEPGH